jgi:hypothetical protein
MLALHSLTRKKAYDRVGHPYLKAVLAKFGFSPQLCSVLTSTFTDNSALLLAEGQTLSPFRVGCGVRQGDPLAPLLYILALEPLLMHLRNHLHGIQLPWGVFQDRSFCG